MNPTVFLAILEDDPSQVLAIQKSIEIELPDCSIRLAQDGRRFLKDLSKIPPPIILILDINVPIISGMEVLKKVRKREDLAWLPIVMFSSEDTSKARLESFRYGATGFEVKPPLAQMGKVLKAIVDKYACRDNSKIRQVYPPLLEDEVVEQNFDFDNFLNNL